MIYTHLIGFPSRVPDDVTHVLGEVLTHYRTGTEWVVYYTDDPTSEADKAEYEKALLRAKKINNQPWPCWA